MLLRRLLAILLLTIPRLASAVPVVVTDTISSPAVVSNAFSVGVLGPTTVSGYAALATPFTTGMDASNLLQVDAVITFLLGSSADATGTNLTVSIFTDSLSAPGSFLAGLTLTPPPNLSRFGFGTNAGIFRPASTLALTPGTTYWVVAEALGDATYTWNGSSTGPNAAVSLSPGVWSSSSYNLATRVTVDALVGAPEFSSGNALTPVVLLVLLVTLSHRSSESSR